MKLLGKGAVILLAGLAQGLVTQGAAQKYTGPQAVIYIGDNWCYGGYCSGGTAASFEAALNQALLGSGYVQAVRKPDNATLNMRAGITGYSNGGGLCLPVLGCVNSRTVSGTLELSDAKTGAVIYRDNCQGTSAGYSTWGWWTGGVSFGSDDDKAAADCAGKLVQKLTASQSLKPYLTLAPGTALGAVSAAPVQPPVQPAAPASTAPSTPVTATATTPDEGASLVAQLEGQVKSLAFADMNALFTSDPYNPVKVKEMNAAATSASLTAASKIKFRVTPGENAGLYQLVGVSYTLPDGQEKFVQLAVTSNGSLNTRGGTRLLYLSAFNPMRTALPALDSLSRNVETLLGDLNAALGLPRP